MIRRKLWKDPRRPLVSACLVRPDVATFAITAQTTSASSCGSRPFLRRWYSQHQPQLPNRERQFSGQPEASTGRRPAPFGSSVLRPTANPFQQSPEQQQDAQKGQPGGSTKDWSGRYTRNDGVFSLRPKPNERTDNSASTKPGIKLPQEQQLRSGIDTGPGRTPNYSDASFVLPPRPPRLGLDGRPGGGEPAMGDGLHRHDGRRRSWGQLIQRPSQTAGRTRPAAQSSILSPGLSQRQQLGPLGRLANDVVDPTRPVSPMAFSEPLYRGRYGAPKPTAAGEEPAEPGENGEFWSEFEARVGSADAAQKQRARTSDGNWDWVDEEKKASLRRQGKRQQDDWGLPRRQTKQQQQEARALRAATAESAEIAETLPAAETAATLPAAASSGYREPGIAAPSAPFEHHRKGRKEKVQTQKPKPRPRRRDNELEMDEYDDYDDEGAEDRRRHKQEKKRQATAAAAAGPVPILLPEFISVANLGAALRVKPHIFLRQLAELGFEEISLESIMTGETAALIAQEYGFEPTVDAGESVDLKRRPPAEDPSTLPERPPIVTIMGHVDHGKTTMLDWLRKSSVAAQEHGGITQHIGAFSVRLSSGKQITFLDTPGHAAFLTMRQRGANVTDIVILVVAADDSVKPQTLEALKHARAAKVPIIVAINKIDKDEARIEQVKSDLARYGVEIEDYGGDVQVVCVSGRTGQGMPDLEESILTLSEILDVRAERDGMAEGWVLESSVKPVGRAASVLVKRGTLRRGDVIAAGTTWARIRVLRNEAGAEIDEAPPGTPVEILGWKDLPDAGDEVVQAPSEARAKEAIDYRQEIKEREKDVQTAEAHERKERERAALAAAAAAAEAAAEAETTDAEGSGATEENAGPTPVNLTVKGDVMGSVEAVCAAIQEIGSNEVRPHVLRSAPGPVTEFDIEHAAATQSSIVNFNQPVSGLIKKKAESAGVAILDHTVIYHLIDDIKDKLSDRLAPTITSKVLGEAEVLQVFPINVKGRVYKNIAGCRVRNGQVTRNGLYRVFRRGEKIFDGKLEALKQGKKDVSEMRKGTECGISFEEWQDMAVGDTIQAYEEIREKRRL